MWAALLTGLQFLAADPGDELTCTLLADRIAAQPEDAIIFVSDNWYAPARNPDPNHFDPTRFDEWMRWLSGVSRFMPDEFRRIELGHMQAAFLESLQGGRVNCPGISGMEFVSEAEFYSRRDAIHQEWRRRENIRPDRPGHLPRPEPASYPYDPHGIFWRNNMEHAPIIYLRAARPTLDASGQLAVTVSEGQICVYTLVGGQWQRRPEARSRSYDSWNC